jgi:hypothetical protein
VDADKIRPVKTTITEVTKDGLILENGLFESADAIIFATGYECASTNYLDKSVIDLYKGETDFLRYQYALAKTAFHPDLENFALIGHLEGLYWNGGQLQAKLAAEVFRFTSMLFPYRFFFHPSIKIFNIQSGKLKLDKEEMRTEIDEIKARIRLNLKQQFPYGSIAQITDKLAKMMNLLPDLDEMKKNDPQLFKMFYENVSIPAHWNFEANPEPALELMNEIEQIYNEEYEFADVKHITFAEKAKLFHEKFNFKTNFNA